MYKYNFLLAGLFILFVWGSQQEINIKHNYELSNPYNNINAQLVEIPSISYSDANVVDEDIYYDEECDCFKI